jgi:hypothetical protein
MESTNTPDEKLEKESKVKVKNDRYVKEHLNEIEKLIVSSITDLDAAKLKKCLEYPEININACVNDKGTTFLHYAASKKDSLDLSYLGIEASNMIESLLKRGADPLLGDHEGLTAKDYSEIKGFKNNMRVLEKAMTHTIAYREKRAKLDGKK